VSLRRFLPVGFKYDGRPLMTTIEAIKAFQENGDITDKKKMGTF
jgi:hypothetical protein